MRRPWFPAAAHSRDGGSESGAREIGEAPLVAGAKNFGLGGAASEDRASAPRVATGIEVEKGPFRQFAEGQMTLTSIALL